MIDIEKTLTYLRENARGYAQAKADRVYLEQYRKSLKAILMQTAESEGIKTGQEREAYAYAHESYKDLLRALQIAVENEEYLKIMLEGCRMKVELYRTEQANERAERRGYVA